jgi:hypothetical protein
MNTQLKTTCPICQKQNTWQPENTFRPFCSDRCKLIDLGEWARETRKIAGASANSHIDLTAVNEEDDYGG